MTAAERITAALAESATITVDHNTQAFTAFRFKISTETRETVVRVHNKSAEFQALSSAAV